MVGYGMPREGDVYGVAFTDDPSRCWRFVHDRNLQACACRQPVA
jgi:hypothetical protein